MFHCKQNDNLIFRILENYLRKSGKSDFAEEFRKFRKYKILEDFRTCLPKNSKFITFVHGNVQAKNIIIDKKNSEVRFLDFEAMQISHPASDFWTFIYSSTDLEWRKENLKACFQTYHETICQYHKYSTFLEFEEEFNFKRGYGISRAILFLDSALETKATSLKKSNKRQNDQIRVWKKLDHLENSTLRHKIFDIIEEAHQLQIL